MKIGTTEIQKVYLGTTELDGLYVGSNSAYVKPSSGGIDEHTVLMCHFDEDIESVSPNEVTRTSPSGTRTYADGKFGKALSPSSSATNCDYSSASYTGLLSDVCTVDFWMRKSDSASSITFYRGSSTSFKISKTVSGDTLSLDASSTSTLSVDISDISADAWFHIAMVNDGTVEEGVGRKFFYYVNGVYKGFTKWSNSTLSGVTKIRVSLLNLDELRISDNVRYTGNFTPPTQPYTGA